MDTPPQDAVPRPLPQAPRRPAEPPMHEFQSDPWRAALEKAHQAQVGMHGHLEQFATALPEFNEAFVAFLADVNAQLVTMQQYCMDLTTYTNHLEEEVYRLNHSTEPVRVGTLPLPDGEQRLPQRGATPAPPNGE